MRIESQLRTILPATIAALLCSALQKPVSTMPQDPIKPNGAVARPMALLPTIPRHWPLPPTRTSTIDFAKSMAADAWMRHPVLGDPSFDSFARRTGSPIVVGSEPFRWPVNVSLLDDPISGNLYAYVGQYLEGYAFGPDLPVTHCSIYESKDRGATWNLIGPIFNDPEFKFAGDTHTSPLAPDVKVVFDGARYHMSYDWCSDNTTWANASAPADGADSGCAYAWSESPKGPFHRASRPILRTSEIQRWNMGSSRYHRVYATSLIRRKHDWLALADLDSGSHFAWGQAALTAVNPEGPWSSPVMISSLEGNSYYPSPVEAFPAFVHDGYVYDPRTSVGMNRNFQLVMRAPLETAERPEAWQIYQHGTAWHADWSPQETYGIWGQTFSGSVDRGGRLTVLFPSRNSSGAGVINLAQRPWKAPLKDRGFTISAHGCRSLTTLRVAYTDFELHADLTLHGKAARLAWSYRAPLGVIGRADGSPAPITFTRHNALEITPDGWRLLKVEEPAGSLIASGRLTEGARRSLNLRVSGNIVSIAIDGKSLWSGPMRSESGPLALLLEPGTNLKVEQFAVRGIPTPAQLTWLASEAVAGAGIREESYSHQTGALWRFGEGVVCNAANERAKWNFRGRGIRLWLPSGPEFGTVTLLLDGQPAGTVNLMAKSVKTSQKVFAIDGLEDGYHALVLKSDAKKLPLDCLDVLQ